MPQGGRRLELYFLCCGARLLMLLDECKGMDRLSASRRSWLMSRIPGKDTTPEMIVRKYLHALGFRYRLHDKNLPGTPDIVLPKYRTVIFVHGCFWHRHHGCRYATVPKSNVAFWARKFELNVSRDKRNISALRRAGWRCLTIWGCETEAPGKLARLAKRML
jgi:DNA mismatch endonuclease (patch repair protein)